MDKIKWKRDIGSNASEGVKKLVHCASARRIGGLARALEGGSLDVMGGYEIPGKNLITPDRRDILSEPEALPSGAEPELETCPAY